MLQEHERYRNQNVQRHRNAQCHQGSKRCWNTQRYIEPS